MRVIYDEEDGVLSMSIGRKAATGCESFVRGPDVALDVANDNSYEVVGLIVIGASVYLPLGKGYDAESDVLTIGETADDPALVTENGYFVGYWEVNRRDPDGSLQAIGVAIRRASVHLAQVLARLPQPVDVAGRPMIA